MKSVECLLLLVCVAVSFTYAGNSNFDAANKLYMTQRYTDAANAYEDIIKKERPTAELYYNLGNCYYKNADYTRAILNYERARKLKPADEDILFNIAVSNQKTVDKIESAPKVFYQKWWDDYVTSSTPGARALLGVIFIWLALAVGCVYIFINKYAIKKLTFFGSFILLFAGLFFVIVASSQNSRSQNLKEAIIIPDNCYVKSSPDEKSTNLFMLHSGTKIELMDELQDWMRIKIPNGNEGWLRHECIEVI